MSERDIKIRLERLVDRWMNAAPGERTALVREKIRLEEMLEQTRQQSKRK
jgi:hypothetical protein